MKVQTTLIIGLAAIMTSLILKDLSGSEAPKGNNLAFGIEDNRLKIEWTCVERLRRIPKTRSVLTADELVAIRTLGSHRIHGLRVTDSLLRVVHMRREKSKFRESNRSTMAWRPIRPDLLTEYPAARALIEIGLPSVHAIMSVLDTSEELPAKDQLKIYSGIVLEVLGPEHARPFVEIESKTLPGKKQNYDALLRVIDKTRTEWLSHKFKIRTPSGKARPEQNVKPAKSPATKPVISSPTTQRAK